MPLFALKSLSQNAALEHAESDYKTAKRAEQFRVSREAIYFPAFPGTQYLPFEALEFVKVRDTALSVKGTCGKQLPMVRLRLSYDGEFYKDLMFDFCANCCDIAIETCLRHAGPKHLMFGLDMPILRLRTHRIEENGTYINLVPPGIYGDLGGDPHMREVSPEEGEKITFFAYEELLAFKRVAEKLGLSRQDVEDVMYNNAKNLIDDARKSIYG